MADIFISYSNEDHEQARLLAAFLEAEGYSVWWDTSLLSGDKFRKVIMTELGRARAAIVIWTKASIQSDWVQSEAGRAHADQKLIPVKARRLSYEEIPPPFDNMHIENADDREKILAAVVAQLAKPQVKPSRIWLTTRQVRFELLSWFGVVGAAVSLAAHIQSVLTLAKWAKLLVSTWTTALTYAWQHILFFVPKLYPADALILSLIALMAMAAGSCMKRHDTMNDDATAMQWIKVVGFSCLIFFIFVSGVAGSEAAPSRYISLLDTNILLLLVGYLRTFGMWLDKITHHRVSYGPVWLYTIYSLTFLSAAFPIMLLYYVISRTTRYHVSIGALANRLSRVVTLLCLIIGLNYLSLWVEQ